jgi:hypothetical protein
MPMKLSHSWIGSFKNLGKKGNGNVGMGTIIFFREWEKGNGKLKKNLGNGNREWELEKVVPAGH